MLCPNCNHPIGVYATDDVVREHAEDLGYVRLPDTQAIKELVELAVGQSLHYDSSDPVDDAVVESEWTEILAEALHSALQGGKHA